MSVGLKLQRIAIAAFSSHFIAYFNYLVKGHFPVLPLAVLVPRVVRKM